MNAIWIAIASISVLGLVFGLILGYASRRFAVEDDPVVEKIDELLPQSQCGQCGYPGCRPYVEAVGIQGEKINRCAPGGEAVMLKIAELLNVDPQPTDGDAQEAEPARMLAAIGSRQRGATLPRSAMVSEPPSACRCAMTVSPSAPR